MSNEGHIARGGTNAEQEAADQRTVARSPRPTPEPGERAGSLFGGVVRVEALQDPVELVEAVVADDEAS